MSKTLTEKFSVVKFICRSSRAPFLTIPSVSQFTLYASTKKGNKPDFHGAAGAEKGKELYDYFFSKVQELHGSGKVKNGVFQAMMDVSLVNDGPVGVDYQSLDGAVKRSIFETTIPPSA